MRYAIYFAPPADGLLWKRACQWLGRDPLRLCQLRQPQVPGLAVTALSELTASARRYGFHATLKAPFRLSEGMTQNKLFAALSDFARGRRAFALPPLEVGNLGGFVALRLSQPCLQLDQLAMDCVRHFDHFRKPPGERELAQRLHGLDERQRALLHRWGYPYVMDQWRFHMTMGVPVDKVQSHAMADFLPIWLDSALQEQLVVEDLCVFVEPAPGEAFELARRFPFASGD